MAHYTFNIAKYEWASDEAGGTYRDYTDDMPLLTVEADNYIDAKSKALKLYPSDKYTHLLIDTDAEHWPDDISVF